MITTLLIAMSVCSMIAAIFLYLNLDTADNLKGAYIAIITSVITASLA